VLGRVLKKSDSVSTAVSLVIARLGVGHDVTSPCHDVQHFLDPS